MTVTMPVKSRQSRMVGRYSMQTRPLRQMRPQFIGERWSMRRRRRPKLNVTQLQRDYTRVSSEQRLTVETVGSGVGTRSKSSREGLRVCGSLSLSLSLSLSVQGVRHILLSLNALQTTGQDAMGFVCRYRDGRSLMLACVVPGTNDSAGETTSVISEF